MAKFILATKFFDGRKVAINANEVISITQYDKVIDEEKTTKCVRVEIRDGYSVDAKTDFDILLQQLREEN